MCIIPQLPLLSSNSGEPQSYLRDRKYLTGDPDFLPVTTPVFDTLPNLILIAIDMRAIDMCIPRLQSNLNRIPNLSLLRQPNITRYPTRDHCGQSPEGPYHVPNPSMGNLAPVFRVASGIDISQSIAVVLQLLLLR